MRTLLLAIALVSAVIAPAGAEPNPMMPGVTSDGSKPSGYLGLVMGRAWSETLGDNLGATHRTFAGWAYGMAFHGEVVNMVTAYGGVFGLTFDLDVVAFTPGTVNRPDERDADAHGPITPTLSWFYVGITPGLALGVLKTPKVALALELGAPLNTDFYGLSAGAFGNYKSFYLGYRIRSGKGWHGQEVLDERIRVGFGDGKMGFIGLEIIDGYSEDEMGRASLGSILKGSYTMVSLIVSRGK